MTGLARNFVRWFQGIFYALLFAATAYRFWNGFDSYFFILAWALGVLLGVLSLLYPHHDENLRSVLIIFGVLFSIYALTLVVMD